LNFLIYIIHLYYTGTKFLTAKYVNANWINNHHPKSHKSLASTTNKHPIIYEVGLPQNGMYICITMHWFAVFVTCTKIVLFLFLLMLNCWHLLLICVFTIFVIA